MITWLWFPILVYVLIYRTEKVWADRKLNLDAINEENAPETAGQRSVPMKPGSQKPKFEQPEAKPADESPEDVYLDPRVLPEVAFVVAAYQSDGNEFCGRLSGMREVHR